MYQRTHNVTATEVNSPGAPFRVAAPEVREAQINQALCRLQGLTESLSREFSGLLGRIGPVLMPVPPTGEKEATGPGIVPKTSMAPLAMQIDNLSDELELLLQRIGSVVSRVEC